jgi:hypothetical protein
MKVSCLNGPAWRIRAVFKTAESSGMIVRWCSAPSDKGVIEEVTSYALDPFSSAKVVIFLGREAAETKSILNALIDLAKLSERVSIIVFNCPKSAAPSLRRESDQSGSTRSWNTTLNVHELASEIDSVFGKKMPESVAKRLSWCVSSSSWSEDVDADVAKMECEKLLTIFGCSEPSEDDITMACFRQRSEAMKFIMNGIESGQVDDVVRETSRGERLLGEAFFGLAISSMIQLWKSSKLDAMRSSVGWSREAAMAFEKKDKDGLYSAMFSPISVDRIHRSSPKPHGRSMATAMFSSICVANRFGNDLQQEMWKTRFYATVLLACGSLNPKDVNLIFKATESQ